MNEISFYEKDASIIPAIIFLCIFVGVSIFMFSGILPLFLTNIGLNIVTLLTLPFIILPSLMFIYLFMFIGSLHMRIKNNTATLKVNTFGIYDNSNVGGLGFIPWDNIRSIHYRSAGRQGVILVNIKDSKEFKASLSFLGRITYYMSSHNRRPKASVFIVLLSPEDEIPEIYTTIITYYKSYKVQT
ncbi:MAG: hypothetical protein ACRC2K_03105 [Clostridium sp.]